VNRELHIDLAARGGVVDASVTVVHFQASAPQIQPGIAMFEAREGVPEAMGLLMDIHENFMTARETILYPMVQAYIRMIGEADLPTLLRSVCPYLIRICNDEYKLLKHFFVTANTAASARPVFRRLLEALWGVLHDVVRPSIIKAFSVDLLCEVRRGRATLQALMDPPPHRCLPFRITSRLVPPPIGHRRDQIRNPRGPDPPRL